MEELINRLKGVKSLSELEDIYNINSNKLIYAIAKSQRYDLLENSNIRLDISDMNTLEELTDFLLSGDWIIDNMNREGFTFTIDELNAIFNIVVPKQNDWHKFELFVKNCFTNKKELNDFIRNHKSVFENYINEKGQYISVSGNLDCDSFIELILKGNHLKLIRGLENYSSSNLKLLVKFLENNKNIPDDLGNARYAQHLFDLKFNLNPNEFIELLNLLKDESQYDIKTRNSDMTLFSELVNENIEYLIDVVSQTKTLPKCLTESSTFRDECIKRNRIDLAVKCILPPDIMNNESLVTVYCKELNIDSKDFYERSKWLLNYQEKNNNIFNTILATSLKDNIFNINKEHYERFINDVEIQMSISKLNDKELIVLSKVLSIYNYKEYDISSMVVNVVNNFSNYQELINSLGVENVSQQDLRKLVSVLQIPDNQYQINNIETLQNYDTLKRQFFVNNFNSNDLLANKDALLKALFNISLVEAQYIDSKYCHDNDDNNTLNNLKNCELQPEIYNYLELINRIAECNNSNDLSNLYNNLRNFKVYDLEIPFESYLRAKYTELYSRSLYRIDERNQVYGPKDSISNVINFNGKNIQVCVPRANFNFFVHCVGSCSLASDVTDTNYRNDWLDRPQLQDHFVACSYINEKGIYSIISQGRIIFGFDTLESGSILGMGNTDIDSIGRYAKAYDGSRGVQEGNGKRARCFVPSEMLKATKPGGYNEIVIERRNTDYSRNNEFKRKPDYIIMMAESMEKDNFNSLEKLFQNKLSFISDEDKKIIQEIGDSGKLKKFLDKYEANILQIANEQNMQLKDMTNKCVKLIMKAKYFEDCLKASSEFDIPLVVVDKTYYFNKLLSESAMYDDKTMNDIAAFYSHSNGDKKKKMFVMLAAGKDVRSIDPIGFKKISEEVNNAPEMNKYKTDELFNFDDEIYTKSYTNQQTIQEQMVMQSNLQQQKQVEVQKKESNIDINNLDVQTLPKIINPELLQRKMKLPNGREISATQYIQEVVYPHIPQSGRVTLSNGANLSVKQFIEECVIFDCQERYNGDFERYLAENTVNTVLADVNFDKKSTAKVDDWEEAFGDDWDWEPIETLSLDDNDITSSMELDEHMLAAMEFNAERKRNSIDDDWEDREHMLMAREMDALRSRTETDENMDLWEHMIDARHLEATNAEIESAIERAERKFKLSNMSKEELDRYFESEIEKTTDPERLGELRREMLAHRNKGSDDTTKSSDSDYSGPHLAQTPVVPNNQKGNNNQQVQNSNGKQNGQSQFYNYSNNQSSRRFDDSSSKKQEEQRSKTQPSNDKDQRNAEYNKQNEERRRQMLMNELMRFGREELQYYLQHEKDVQKRNEFSLMLSEIEDRKKQQALDEQKQNSSQSHYHGIGR